jgi:hypothetical protein
MVALKDNMWGLQVRSGNSLGPVVAFIASLYPSGKVSCLHLCRIIIYPEVQRKLNGVMQTKYGLVPGALKTLPSHTCTSDDVLGLKET